MDAPKTFKEYEQQGLRLMPSQIKDLYKRIDQAQMQINKLKNERNKLLKEKR